MKIFAFIFARGGSKGIKNKNIKLLNNKPLIVHSILAAKNNKLIDNIYVSSDDKKIEKICKNYKVNFIPRPKNLAKDNSHEWLAWQHAINWLNKKNIYFDIMINLPATSPLREQSDINKCIKSLDNKTDIIVTIKEPSRNPWFNMVKSNNLKYLKLVNEGQNITRRQDAPKVYDLTTVAYVMRPNFILKNKNIFNGRVKGVKIPIERSIDIDTELDFKIANFLIKDKKNYVRE